MTLTLSEDQYKRLLTLTVLGEWMINAIRKEPDIDYEMTASTVYAGAKESSLESLIRFDSNNSSWTPSELLEDNAHALIDQYDEVVFWEELTNRLVERDLIRKYGERAVQSMRQGQKERESFAIAKVYTREFEDQGLERLQLK